MLPAWSAALDLAYTRVMQGDAGAAEALAAAQTRRPPGVPTGHPLDAAAGWLQAWQAAGREDAPAVRDAREALLAAQKNAHGMASAGRGTIRGLLL